MDPGSVTDLLLNVVGGAIAGIVALILKWLGDRRKNINEIKTLLADLRVELQQNKGLPRPARTKIRAEALNRSISELLIAKDMRSALQEVDHYSRVLHSLGDRPLSVDSVFQNQYVPAVEKALPLVNDEQRRWDAKKWWKVWCGIG
ncbi:hypothetical protein MYX75_07030 [Acidobacteria bacterium AH-259-A15]|nr:hypothetical protein [Acidobacteria bacterium AH-259-A15]